jgi:chain length determinant protein tyrosine kinase EpsG
MKAAEDLRSLDGAPPRFLARSEGSLGGILADEGKLETGDIERVLELQRARGLRFGEAALRLGLITREDLEQAIARQYDLPQPAERGHGASELVIAYEPSHPSAEDLRALRTQLQIRWSGAAAAPRALAVVSPGSGEGRSYLAANLAVAFAQLGERTLLVDADLRAPRQHRIFGVADRIGLSAALSGRAGREALAPVPDFGPLSLLPAGARPPNPQELLARPAFAELLRGLRGAFDVVLFDTPPARLYADAHGVAFRAGSALVLARKDQTRLADVAGVIRELGDAGARVMGTVFNAR